MITALAVGATACGANEGDGQTFSVGMPTGPTETMPDTMPGDTDDVIETGGTDGESTDSAEETGSDSGEVESDTTPVDPPDNPTAAYLEEARKDFPTYERIHALVVQRTCTPFPNVCHNDQEYPDLRTPQGVLDRIGRPCNISELANDPANVFNGCEPTGDTITFTDGGNVGYSVEVGWLEVNDDGMGGGNAILHLRDPMPSAMAIPGTFESISIDRLVGASMQNVGSMSAAISYAPGARAIQINATATFADDVALVETDLTVGDPNQDDVYGATMTDPMEEIRAGDPWNSYLLQRLQGNVPGSPMPLANAPLSAAEVIAIACWIEGTVGGGEDSAEDPIDYDDCQYAQDLSEPPEGGGATLSGHIQPIFDQSCAFAGCHHNVNPAAGLDLSPGNSRGALLDVVSTQNDEKNLVTPANPTNSYMVTKLTGAGTAGGQMPLNGLPISDGQIEIIRTWILQGAPDN